MKRLHRALAGIALVLTANSCFANLVITGTRVIYPSDAKTITVKMTNEGELPSLAQSWIDDGDAEANPDTAKSPFLLTPPIIRVNPSQGQELRVMYTGQGLPANKESIFWLNVLDIPPKQASPTGNQLSLAVRSRLKLFYRPSALANPTDKDYRNMAFSLNGDTVTVENKSPYYMSVVALDVSGVKSTQPFMVAPFSSLPVKMDRSVGRSGKISYSIVDDYGAVRHFNY